MAVLPVVHRPINASRRLIREFSAYCSYALKPDRADSVRVLIFGQGRSGSTVLEDLICSSGHFRPGKELLSRKKTPFGRPFLFPTQYILGLARSRPGNFIFHSKIYQLEGQQQLSAHDFLEDLQGRGWKIIYLHRANKVRQVISNYVRKQRGMAHKFDDEPEQQRFRVQPAVFAKQVRKRIALTQREHDALRGLTYHPVVYERDLLDGACHQRTVDQVLEHLSLGPRPVGTRYRKIVSRPLEEIVENFDELAEHLVREGLGDFLG